MTHIFSKTDEGRQFIEVDLIDNSDTRTVFDEISAIFPIVSDYLFEVGKDAFFIEVLFGVEYGFCLNDFRKALNRIAATTVKMVTVDLDEVGQLA